MTLFETLLPLPDFENKTVDRIAPLSVFTATKLKGLSSSLKTAVDQRERDDLLADMMVCDAALALLNLAYWTEDDRALLAARDLLRKV